MASISHQVSKELCQEAQRQHLFVPPNLVWRMGIVLWHERVSFIATRDTGRTSIVTICDEEEIDTPFRDFQKHLYTMLSELPDEYSYFDHIGTLYTRSSYLLLEIHFSSPEQVANCLDGLESTILTQKLTKCLSVWVSALRGVDMNASLVIFSNLDTRLKQVLHENTSIAYNLVYTEKHPVALWHALDPSLYAPIKAAYEQLVKRFPDFFGETGPVDIFPSSSTADVTVTDDAKVTTVPPTVAESFKSQPKLTAQSLACSPPNVTESKAATSMPEVISTEGLQSSIAASQSVSHLDQIATALNTQYLSDLPENTSPPTHSSTLETAEPQSLGDSSSSDINWEDVTDQEMVLIAEMIPPKQYEVVGLHLGLSMTKIQRAQADSRDSMHFILNILHEAKINCLASRAQLALALAKSNLSRAAKVVDPAVDLNQVFHSKINQYSQNVSEDKLYLVDGTLHFYDRELAHEYLKTSQPITFWAALHTKIAAAIKESLTRYQIPVLSTTVGSFVAKIQFQSFNQAFHLANDIANGQFVKVVQQKLSLLGYENHVAVKLEICNSEVTPFSCPKLYLNALESTYTTGAQIPDHESTSCTVNPSDISMPVGDVMPSPSPVPKLGLSTEISVASSTERQDIKLSSTRSSSVEKLSNEEFKKALEEQIRSRGYQHHVSVESEIDQDVHSYNIELFPPSSQSQEQASQLPQPQVTSDSYQHVSSTATPSVASKSLPGSEFLAAHRQRSTQRQFSDDLKSCRSKTPQISVGAPLFQRSMSLDPNVISRRDVLPSLHVKSGKQFQERLKSLQPEKATGYQITFSDANIFFYLIRKGESAKVQQQIEKGASLSQTDSGHMPIHVAAHYGRADIVKMIIMHGGSVDVRTNTKLKLSSLHIAARYGHLKVVQVLVEQGADIEARTSEGLTPLAMAASEGFANIVEFLLNQGANTNSQCDKNITPLSAAACFGRTAVVQVLLKHNADTTLLDDGSKTAIHSAVLSENPEILKLILEANPKALNHPNIVNSITPPVITVCKRGNLAMLETMLQYNADINTVDKYHITPLIVACIDGNVKLIDTLVKHGAKIDQVVPVVGTPLHAAIERGQKQAAEKLLQLGLPPDTIDTNGITPLMKAIEFERIEIAELLLKYGANVSLEHPKTGRPPLHRAAARNETEMLKLLLAHGADINQCTSQGSTALHLAATFGSADAIDLLCTKNGKVNIQNVIGCTPLAAANQSRKFDCALRLLKYSPDVNICDKNQVSPLYAATDFRAAEVVHRLLELGAKSDIPDRNGLTPIQMACQRGYDEILKLMVEADPHVLESQTVTVEDLIFSAIGTNSSTLQVLLQAGVNPNVRHPTNQLTPLHKVCCRGDVAMLQQLISSGADPKLQSPIGTALHAAVLVGQYQCAKLLLEFGVDPNATAGQEKATPLILAAESDHSSVKMIKLLIDYKADLNAALKTNGYTAMHKASSGNHVAVAQLLIDKGADINRASNDGFVPLHMAVSSGSKEVVEVLLEAKCKLNVQDNEGLTPLMRAIHAEQFEIASDLMDYGADVTLCSKKGLHVMHLAAQVGSKEVVEVLLEAKCKLDVQDNEGLTPLMRAIHAEQWGIAFHLMNYGADVTLCSKNGLHAMHLAAHVGSKEVVKVLSEAKCKLDVQDNEGLTPLMWAIHAEQFGIAFDLMHYGADVTLCSNSGLHAMHLAAQVGSKGLIEKLLSLNVSPDVQQKNGVTPLHLSIYTNDIEISKVLLSNGANVNIEDCDELTPLHVAASKNNVEAVELLLKHGADPSLKDCKRKTPEDRTTSMNIKKLLDLKLNQTKTNPELKTQKSLDSDSITDIDTAARNTEPDCLDKPVQQLNLPRNDIMSSALAVFEWIKECIDLFQIDLLQSF